jgi:HEPN domain-containing protein
MKKVAERDSHDVFLDFIPIPKPREARLALAYAEISRGDIDAAKVLYKRHLYQQAVYMLQQTVEKSAKSFGLMIGIVKPKDLREISHRSVYALLIRMDRLVEYLG